MKWIYFLLSVCALPLLANAQPALYNNGATISISSGTQVKVSGDLTNASGTFTNGGTIGVTGHTDNNGTLNATAGSTLLLNGTSSQTLGGNGIMSVNDVVVDNTVGITLTAPLQVDGSLTFTSGMINATNASAPVIFTATGTVGNSVTDASHVNGYVRKLGTGSFTFPVGSSTKYQPVTVDLTANGSGLTALYTAGDAGTSSFTNTGSQATPLVSYNQNEYWDLSPVSTATGTVTLYWDDVNETAYGLSSRRVAHKTGGTWQNEDGSATGTNAAGSIISNAVSSWGPFTNGSLSFPLPVRWLGLSGTLNAQGKATIRWQVTEANTGYYEVQKSDNARTFRLLAMLHGSGAGTHSYQFAEDEPLHGRSYYRILQREADGHISYSEILLLRSPDQAASVTLYPNPTVSNPLLSVPANLIGKSARLYNSNGMLVRQFTLTTAVQKLDLSTLSKGTYLLQVEGGQNVKVLKVLY